MVKIPVDIHDFIDYGISVAEDALKVYGGASYYYRIGPVTMAVVFIGDQLKDVLDTALQHNRLYNIPDNVTATIFAVDSAALKSTAPPDAWPFPVDTRDHFQRVHWQPADGMALASDETRGIWHLFNSKVRKGVYWVRSGDELPSWEAGAPLRIFIHWLACLEGVQLVHAASLVFNNHGMLLTGAGGSGKSTTTAAALISGWSTAGDDFVLVKKFDQPVAYCIYDTVKLSGMALDVMPEIAKLAVNPGRAAGDKARVHLHNLHGSQLISNMSISAIFSIKIGYTELTEICQVKKSDVMKALAPSTLFMLRTGMQESFTQISKLINSLPCYHIKLGNNPYEAIEKLRKFVNYLYE